MVKTFLKSTIKTPEWIYWRRSGVFIVNVKQTWHIDLVFPVDFETTSNYETTSNKNSFIVCAVHVK